MRRFKLFGVGALAVCALSLAALPVSAAWAKSKGVLQFDEGETPAANEAKGAITFSLDTCIIRSTGHLTGNDAASIKLVTTESESSCNEAVSESGSIKEATMSSKKKLTMTGSITINEETEAGHCIYVFSKFKGTFAIPGPVSEVQTLSGKLSKAGSAKTCAKTLSEPVRINAVYPVGETEETQVFNAVVVS